MKAIVIYYDDENYKTFNRIHKSIVQQHPRVQHVV